MSNRKSIAQDAGTEGGLTLSDVSKGAETQVVPSKRSTIREQLQAKELMLRNEDARKTKFDAGTDIQRELGSNQIKIPAGMRSDDVVKWVGVWAAAESQMVRITESISGIPIDAARALNHAVLMEFGMTKLNETFSFFGVNPPPFISVPVDYHGNTEEVFVGEQALPGFEAGKFTCAPDNNNICLMVGAEIRRKDVPMFHQLLASAREILATDSLYRGKSIVVDLDDLDEQPLILPSFWNVEPIRPLIVNRETQALIDTTINAPIKYTAVLKGMGQDVGRKTLLYGPFGTGKTLCAYNTAQVANENGWTFAYVKNITKLASAIAFAQVLAPCVLFVEDGERSFQDADQIAEIQLALDGVNTKNRDLIIILTTNYVEQVPEGILRPGRIDAAVRIGEPDGETACRLVRFYAGDKLAEDADMSIIGDAIAGNIPATISEFVNRAKLYALTRNGGDPNFTINHEDIQFAVLGMKQHTDLMKGAHRQLPPSPVEQFGMSLGVPVAGAIRDAVRDLVVGVATQSQKANS